MLLNMIALATSHDENYKKEARPASPRCPIPALSLAPRSLFARA